ncbi:MAG: DUF1059 domain-containing protein [Caldilineae bacterium]|nr:MAG: DUF1059 domain-containing protein [Caldilineae bacterium]
MKVLRCRDLGFDCDGVVEAATEEELLRQVAAHAEQVHQVKVTPEIIAEVKKHIQET